MTMDDYLVALGYVLLPALGNFAGGLLAERVALRPAALSFALHLAAGVIFAVVGLGGLGSRLDMTAARVDGEMST